jgi:hypothetical protein
VIGGKLQFLGDFVVFRGFPENGHKSRVNNDDVKRAECKRETDLAIKVECNWMW